MIKGEIQAVDGGHRKGFGALHDETVAVVEGHVRRVHQVIYRKLSGEALNARRGTFRDNFREGVEIRNGVIRGFVRPPSGSMGFALFQEFGFSGPVTVREHLRTVTTAFGRDLLGASMRVTIPAHVREVDYPAHSFMRSAVAEVEGASPLTDELHLAAEWVLC